VGFDPIQVVSTFTSAVEKKKKGWLGDLLRLVVEVVDNFPACELKLACLGGTYLKD